MASCHDLFIKFQETIKLTDTKNDYLMKARDSIRNRIDNYFKDELKEKMPNHKMQGSFAIKTTVNPLDGEFDIDDGIYLNNLSESMDEWPSPSTVHNWIYKAVDGHTKEKPIDKNTCIRVKYAGEYHVDLPTYCKHNSTSYLADKSDKGWHESDAIKFKDWFIKILQTNDEQLRQMVRYFKAWANYECRKGSMPKSIILTVLAVESYSKYSDEDACFSNILNTISTRISNNFIVLNPVDPKEDLAEKLTDNQKDRFKESILSFAKDSIEALQCDDKEKACNIWHDHFGDRFPSCKDLKNKEKAMITSAPAILKDDARSAQ